MPDATPPSPTEPPSRAERVLGRVLGHHRLVVVLFAVALVPAIVGALRLQQDNSVDRLVVVDAEDARAARAMARSFGGGDDLVVLLEAPDPLGAAALLRLDTIEQRLAAVEHVRAASLLSAWRQAHGGFAGAPEEIAGLHALVKKSAVFGKQGLLGEHFLVEAITLDAQDGAERRRIMARVDEALAPLVAAPAPFTSVRRVGQPWIDATLDEAAHAAVLQEMPLCVVFIVVLVLLLYRSLRALAAFVIALATSLALTVGLVGLTGGVFTLVSSLVPMTALITCTATLVYVHSRFVVRPRGRPIEEHRVHALVDKLPACTASLFAGAVGFAALAVSRIGPIREMGLWVAAGIGFSWLVAFTLFPSLAKLLRAPSIEVDEATEAHAAPTRLLAASWRWRWPLVVAALVLCAAGAACLLGIPGVMSGMHLEEDPLEYLPQGSDRYLDARRVESLTGGLAVTDAWLHGERAGSVTDPDVLAGLADFEGRLARDPRVAHAVGLPTALRTMRALTGQSDVLPTDGDKPGWQTLSDELDGALAQRGAALARVVRLDTLAETRLSVVTRAADDRGFRDIEELVRRSWAEAKKSHAALGVLELTVTGHAAVQARIAHELVPTLAESFGLSVLLIYGAFLLIFRSGAARLLAMIPSLMSILALFVIMRVAGVKLNVATILIASTVLGASENDQIHLFYHYLSERRTMGVGAALARAFAIAGRPIVYATVINAGGFLAFALAGLPPIRQFGLLSATAFVLSMLADFTALPAALWLVLRARPED